MLALVLMIPTSFPVVRRKAYEWFYLTHWVLFVIAVFFAILHWSQIIWWIFPAGLVFFVSRASSSWNSFTPVPVQEMTLLGQGEQEIFKIVVKRSSSQEYDYKVGNFVYLNVPALSKTQRHALTIASSPKTCPTDLTVLIKPLGDWSQQSAVYAKQCSSEGTVPEVFMDGFYGSSLEMYEEYPTLVLVGGGIGVTPLLAILEGLTAKVRAEGVWTQNVLFMMSFRDYAVASARSNADCSVRSGPEARVLPDATVRHTKSSRSDLEPKSRNREPCGKDKVDIVVCACSASVLRASPIQHRISLRAVRSAVRCGHFCGRSCEMGQWCDPGR